MRFYRCNHCGNVIGKVIDSGVPVVCCGEKMVELLPNTTDAAFEKHVPVIKVEGKVVTVTVGSTLHPMLDEHFIEFIYLQTKQGGQRKSLKPGDKPEATFALSDDDEAVSAYAYCNLHGLWKADI